MKSPPGPAGRATHSPVRLPVWAAILLPVVFYLGVSVESRAGDDLDAHLAKVLEAAGFTGRIESTLEQRLGRPINPDLADLGRLLWFDKITGLHNDNTCAGCHSPTNGFGDTQSIAIGIQNNAVQQGGPITFTMFGQAIAEFEFTLTFADAPIDRFARGDRQAMTHRQKRGALLFFGEAGCVQCHAVKGKSNEMFSDFEMHTIGIPQIAPVFGVGTGNFEFSGPAADEDFGLEDFTGDPGDRYRFRTSPLRNLALQPAFFHNGSFTRLEEAVRHHLHDIRSLLQYDAVQAGVAPDLTLREGPRQPVLDRIDPLLVEPIRLSHSEFKALVAFLREGLLDPRAPRPTFAT